MTRAVEVFRSASKRPMEAIEVILALTLFGAGLYLLSPTYVIQDSGMSTTAQAFADNDLAHMSYGLFGFIVPAAPILLGLFLRRFNTITWRTRSTFMMFLAFLFTALFRVIVIGPVPILWVFPLALAFVSAVCYLYVRVRHT